MGKASWLSGCLRRNLWTLSIVACSVLGFGAGQALRQLDLSQEVLLFIDLPSVVLMRSFRMLVVPLIACGVTLGMASIRRAGSGRTVGATMAFFAFLMVVASIYGCFLIQIVHPGQAIGQHSQSDAGSSVEIKNDTNTPNESSSSGSDKVVNTIIDFIKNLMPDNLMTASFMKRYTVVEKIKDGNNVTRENREEKISFSTNYTGLLVVCILVGFAIAALGEKAQTIHTLIEEVNAIMMKILNYLIKILPLGIFFWLFNQSLRIDSPGRVFASLGYFLALYVGAQVAYQLIFLPVLYFFIVRKNPVRFYGNIFPAVMMAFGCASSAATLPVTLRCMEDPIWGVSRRVGQFVLPLGVILNMQGSAMSTPMTTIFIAQMEGSETGIIETTILCAVSVLFAMASPGIPSTGTPVSFLTSLNIIGIEKAYFVGVMVAVDWFLDRFRTTNNVVGDCYVAAFVEKLCPGKLEDPPGDKEMLNLKVVIDCRERDDRPGTENGQINQAYSEEKYCSENKTSL